MRLPQGVLQSVPKSPTCEEPGYIRRHLNTSTNFTNLRSTLNDSDLVAFRGKTMSCDKSTEFTAYDNDIEAQFSFRGSVANKVLCVSMSIYVASRKQLPTPL